MYFEVELVFFRGYIVLLCYIEYSFFYIYLFSVFLDLSDIFKIYFYF